jgi:AcrR family transcriptional regulator
MAAHLAAGSENPSMPDAPRSKPLKRPTQARSKFTVQAIYDAFVRIWNAHGWEGVTTRAVALETGIAVGTLYDYFPDKEAMLSGYVRHCVEALLARLDAECNRAARHRLARAREAPRAHHLRHAARRPARLRSRHADARAPRGRAQAPPPRVRRTGRAMVAGLRGLHGPAATALTRHGARAAHRRVGRPPLPAAGAARREPATIGSAKWKRC